MFAPTLLTHNDIERVQAKPANPLHFPTKPMHTFSELSHFMATILAAPASSPTWLRDFDSKPIGITVKFQTKPEQRNNFVDTMKRHQLITNKEEGAEAVPHFKIHTSPFDDNVFYLIEEWQSAAALRKHFTAPYMWQTVNELNKQLVDPSISQTYVALYDLGMENLALGKTALAYPEGESACIEALKAGGNPDPQWNIGVLADLMDVVMKGPDDSSAPAWLKQEEFGTMPRGITVKWEVKPEKRQEFVDRMIVHRTLTFEREGHAAVSHFKFHTSPFDENVFYLVEEWQSFQALRKHFVADYMAETVSMILDILVEGSKIWVALYNLGFEKN